MPKMSIFRAFASQTTVNETQLTELATFLVKNRNVVVTGGDAKTLAAARSLTVTPISTAFARAIDLGHDRLFSFLKIPAAGLSCPEVVTYRYFTFDTRQFAGVADRAQRALEALPEFKDKIVLNVTQLTKRSGELSDTKAFQSLVVRDLLSRAYYQADRTWLPPALAQYLCKVYSMSVSGRLGAKFDLSYPETQLLATVFSVYFLKQLGDAHSAEVLVKTFARALYLPSPDTIDGVLAVLKSKLPHGLEGMSLDDACAVTHELGVQRLSLINRRVLLELTRSLAPDITTAALALEYPPYWAWLVLLAASGEKIGLAYTLKQGNLLADAGRFADDLLKAPGFLGAL